MSTLNRFLRNTAVLILCKALQPLITFYLIITIGREIGVVGFGEYSTIFKYIVIFQTIAAFGLRNLLTREVAQDKHKTQGYLVSASYIALAFALMSGVGMTVLAATLSENPVVVYGTMVASISLLASALADVYEGTIAGHERLTQIGYALLAENLLRVIVSLVFLKAGFGVIALVWIFVSTRFFNAAYLFLFVNKKIARPYGRPDWQSVSAFVAQAKTFALIMICVTIYWNVDAIMLEAMTSTKEAGLYSAAYRLLTISMVVVQSYMTALFPVISNFYKTSLKNFEMACKQSLRILILAIVPVVLVLSLQAEKVILLLFKEEYAASVLVLRILIWGLIPYVISQIFAYGLVTSHKQNIDLRVNALSMFLNIGLNFVLIPYFSFVGAAVATLVSVNVYVALQMPSVFQRLLHFDLKSLSRQVARVIALGGLTAVFIRLLGDLHVLTVVPLAFVFYGIGLFPMRLISKSDRQMVFQLVRKNA